MNRLLLALLATLPHREPSRPFEATRLARIHVEAGALEPLAADTFAIRDPGLRAVVPMSWGDGAKVRFTYLGPTKRDLPLASGELRRQIGVKLRAQDTCNIVYVMWHIEPTPGVQVQVKANPGQASHAQCRDHGYRTIRPSAAHHVPPIRVGEAHTLYALLRGRRLHVSVDGAPVWEGELPREVQALHGPAGIRSDNAEFTAALFTSPAR